MDMTDGKGFLTEHSIEQPYIPFLKDEEELEDNGGGGSIGIELAGASY